jgi:hypothetical protein
MVRAADLLAALTIFQSSSAKSSQFEPSPQAVAQYPLSLSSSLEGPFLLTIYFGKMDVSQSTLRFMARGYIGLSL